jgi:Na+-driven multidrug efflux pump
MPLVWLFNGLASILRGTGNMIVPSLVICLGTAVLLPLPALLIFGWGLMPGFGVAGGGMAVAAYYALGCAALLAYFKAGRSVVQPRFSRLQWRYMRDMLRVGGIGALNTLQTNGTTAVLTALFAAFGAAGIAGYGVSSRIEYVLIPFGFGFGAPLVAIVGTNLGAGNVERAYRAAWIGAAIAFAVAETVGLLAATFPARWIGLFDTDPQIIAAGSVYLRHVGPFYGLFGAAIVLHLVSQGAQRVMWPFLAGTARLLVAAGGGSIAVAWFGASLEAVSLLVAIGVILFGGINIAAVWTRTWTKAAQDL